MDDRPWPSLLRVRPRSAVLFSAAVLVVVWGLLVAVDVGNVGGLGDRIEVPLWTGLFNDGVVEIAQWVFNALAIVAAGYLAGRLARGAHSGAASFFLVMSIGLGLILIEEAGDVRFKFAGVGEWLFGSTILGTNHVLFTSAPVYALLAAFPIYALIRYGKHVWRAPAARKYLVATFSLYGASQLASLTAHVDGFYVALGTAIDEVFFGGEFPAPAGQHPGITHFFIVDATVEETLEMLAVGCMLAMILAFAADLRAGRVPSVMATPKAGAAMKSEEAAAPVGVG